MAASRTLLMLFISLTVFAMAQGQGATNSRSDRISQAISASVDAINGAVGGRTSVQDAVAQSKNYAKLASNEAAKPSDFGRKLQQGATNSRSDRISQAISASSDAINGAVGGSTSVQAAVTRTKNFAKLASNEAAKPSDFNRKLLQGATNSRSDRISQAISASAEAINGAVGGRTSVQAAVTQTKNFAKLASNEAAKPSDFGRKLQQGATNSRSDRISQAISASEDAINGAVGGRTSVQAAVAQSKNFAKLASNEAAKPSDFGRKLQQGATNSRSDRISQAISASVDAINGAVGGRTSVQDAVAQSKNYAKLASNEAAKPSDFGH